MTAPPRTSATQTQTPTIHVPIGIYDIWYIVTNRLVQLRMWPVAVGIFVAGSFFGVAMPVSRWFTDENSPYPFREQEMARFHVQAKMERLALD